MTLLPLLLAATLVSGQVPLVGDVVNGARLYRLHCAACHGPERDGKGYLAKTLSEHAPRNLGDPGFMSRRTDEDIVTIITLGGKAVSAHFTMPNFGGHLEVLEAWDLVAHLRQDVLAAGDFFPDGARFVAREFELTRDSQARLKGLIGALPSRMKTGTLLTVYGGQDVPPEGPLSTPPGDAELKDTQGRPVLGYVLFTTLALEEGGKPVTVGLSASPDLTLLKVVPQGTSAPLAALKRALKSYEGRSATVRGAKVRIELPEGAEVNPAVDRELNRAYALLVVAAQQETARSTRPP